MQPIKMPFKQLFVGAILLIISALPVLGQDCKKLADGQYHFKHKTKVDRPADFTLTIKGNRYTFIKDGQKELVGEIQWWSDCTFKLNADNQVPVNTDSLNSFQKRLVMTEISWGGRCYELTGKHRFRLTYCGNLHITMSEGRVIKRGR